MTKRKKTLETKPAAVATSDSGLQSWFTAKAIRETIESVAIAFILAFLFRTFEAEAFVIPTGSMAPTLMGAHKDLHCPECGYQYRAGASSEVDQMAQQRGRAGTGEPVVWATCPLCRYTAPVGPGHDHPTYGGDRILVSKFAYEFGEPERWDVVVFKYPMEAQTNYIKRCVGLPDETLRIRHGDLHVKPLGGDAFAISRRDPSEQVAMAQIVYDNDYVVDAMTEAGWPLRWQNWPAQAEQEGWKSDDGGRSFTISASAGDAQWLRYQHFVPSLADWVSLENGRLPEGEIKPLLITDFYAYDTSLQRNQAVAQPRMLGLHWVGDLHLECELESKDGQGEALLDLVKGGVHFRCQLDFESGEATLAIDGVDGFHPKAQTAARGAGRHHVRFANVDRQLVLWVDGEVVTFDGSTEYEPLDNENPKFTADDPLDLAPAGVGGQGADLAVQHLRLWRDIYYIATSQSGPMGPSDYTGPSQQIAHMNYSQLYTFLSSPELWDPQRGQSPFDERGEAVFPLASDQYFMLGDNSPMSEDARLWGQKYVQRELLIGRALIIFWPHSFNQIPGTSIPLPFFPNFARMGFIK